MFIDIFAHIFAKLLDTILFVCVFYKGSGLLLRIPFMVLDKEDWFDKMWSKPMNWIGIKGVIDYKTRGRTIEMYKSPNIVSDPRYSFLSGNIFNSNRH